MQLFLRSISAQHHVYTFVYLPQKQLYYKVHYVHLEEVCYQQQPDGF